MQAHLVDVATSRGDKMKVEKVLITPDVAKQMLASSAGNRSIRKARVDMYASQMLSGEWHFNGDTIRVYADGSTQDGHHRLEAVVKSGVPMWSILVTGITKEAALTVDKGSNRTAADNLLFLKPELGTEMAGMMSTLSRYLILHDLGLTWDKAGGAHARYLADDKKIEYMSHNETLMIEACEFARDTVQRGNTMLTKSVVAALYCLGSRIDKGRTKQFLSLVFLGYGMEQGTTEDHLRNQLLKCSQGTLKWSMSMKIRTTARCLKSALAGRNIKHAGNITYRAGEDIARFPTL